MNKTAIAVLVSMLAAASAVQAQSQSMSPSTEIRESTDPARVAEVERRAADLMSRQQSSSGTGAASGTSDASSAERPMKKRQHQGRARQGKTEGSDTGSR
ncbi:hypothetical protein [Noviherbaspirillum aridicola]|uniref:Uncharacterized protein n=1 Tax=Noviherbaspirillum aridicola TaxID=2849687 RepID=A0ABQ4Q323_9BURK|nr:hypothetical protein [Noviherbaspirillum aridicola]GIZ51588.1 hypothetical protein NCCP691_16020 [Noviherbaspirillum aridicola]